MQPGRPEGFPAERVIDSTFREGHGTGPDEAAQAPESPQAPASGRWSERVAARANAGTQRSRQARGAGVGPLTGREVGAAVAEDIVAWGRRVRSRIGRAASSIKGADTAKRVFTAGVDRGKQAVEAVRTLSGPVVRRVGAFAADIVMSGLSLAREEGRQIVGDRLSHGWSRTVERVNNKIEQGAAARRARATAKMAQTARNMAARQQRASSSGTTPGQAVV